MILWLRFLVCANTVSMLSNGEYFDAEMNEKNDLELFEGDIYLTEDQRRMIMSGGGDITSYSAQEGVHWPNGIVPYQIIDSSNSANISDFKNPENSYMFKDFTKQERGLIMEAIKRFHANTCLKFVERRRHHQYYIRIENRLQLDKNSLKWRERGPHATLGLQTFRKHPTTNVPGNRGQFVNIPSQSFQRRDRNNLIVPKIGT